MFGTPPAGCLSFLSNGADVVPHQPVIVEYLCPVPRIEGPSYGVARFDIHAYPKCRAGNEPTSHQPEQLRSHSASSRFRDDVDPLQFSVAGIPSREMPGGKGDKDVNVNRHVTRSRCACVLRIQLTCEVSGDSSFPILWLTPFACTNTSHGDDVIRFCWSVKHGNPLS
jgi:hypothetical protein